MSPVRDPPRRRQVGFAAACAALVATLVACASILGIDERPLRGDSGSDSPFDAGAIDGGGTDAADAGADARCDRLASRPCSADCPRDFCDDFDLEGQAPETRWKPAAGYTNPVVSSEGEGGVALTSVDASSPPRALTTATSSTLAETSFRLLGHELDFRANHDSGVFDGVRVACDFRIDALTFESPGGPVPDAGNAAMLGMVRADIAADPHGIAIVLGGSSLYLVVADDLFGGTGGTVQKVVSANRGITFFQRDWLQLELFVGDRDRAVALGYGTCAAGDVGPGLVAVAALGGRKLGEGCVNVPTLFGPATWPEAPVVIAGSILFGRGAAAFRYDNVAADFYVK